MRWRLGRLELQRAAPVAKAPPNGWLKCGRGKRSRELTASYVIVWAWTRRTFYGLVWHPRYLGPYRVVRTYELDTTTGTLHDTTGQPFAGGPPWFG